MRTAEQSQSWSQSVDLTLQGIARGPILPDSRWLHVYSECGIACGMIEGFSFILARLWNTRRSSGRDETSTAWGLAVLNLIVAKSASTKVASGFVSLVLSFE